MATDIPNKDVLIACKHTVEEIRDLVGADSLGFLSLESLPEIVKGKCGGYCDACFSGNYPTKFLKDFVKVNPTFTALLLNVWKFNG